MKELGIKTDQVENVRVIEQSKKFKHIGRMTLKFAFQTQC